MGDERTGPELGAFSRRRLQGAAFGAAAALAGTRGALAWPGVPAPAASKPADPDALFLSVAGLEPQEFSGGTIRFARSATLPALEGLSLAAITLSPRSVRELHWHDNASELTHILSGSGVAIIVDGSETTVVPLEPGTLACFPQGYAHALWNTANEPMEMVLGFDTADPETVNLSTALPPVPSEVFARSAGVKPGETPFLPSVTTAFAVPVTGAAPAPTAGAGRLAAPIDSVELETFPGGSRRVADPGAIPGMRGLMSTLISFDPGGSRVPHWHPNADEIAYCLSGTMQMGIVGPDGFEQTSVMAPGDLAFIPVNWFHYAVNVGDEPATMILYHDAPTLEAIDLPDVLAGFPPEVLAASFGLDGAAFSGLAQGGNPVIAAGS